MYDIEGSTFSLQAKGEMTFVFKNSSFLEQVQVSLLNKCQKRALNIFKVILLIYLFKEIK